MRAACVRVVRCGARERNNGSSGRVNGWLLALKFENVLVPILTHWSCACVCFDSIFCCALRVGVKAVCACACACVRCSVVRPPRIAPVATCTTSLCCSPWRQLHSAVVLQLQLKLRVALVCALCGCEGQSLSLQPQSDDPQGCCAPGTGSNCQSQSLLPHR